MEHSDIFVFYIYWLASLLLKSIIFWDVTPCSVLRCSRCFGGTYRLHLQGWRKFFSKKQHWFLLKFFLQPCRWRRYVPPKRRLHLNTLHGVTSQKMILFITTAVKTSNPTSMLLLQSRNHSVYIILVYTINYVYMSLSVSTVLDLTLKQNIMLEWLVLSYFVYETAQVRI
jgi:hypothetical protein